MCGDSDHGPESAGFSTVDPDRTLHRQCMASQGKKWRILFFPIWAYCDNTSGNVSKKWNKHNSFLFMLAGLTQSHTHKEYNVHFLCTLNLAALLKMMDGIAAQFEWVFRSLTLHFQQLTYDHPEKHRPMVLMHGAVYYKRMYWSYHMHLLCLVTIPCRVSFHATLVCMANISVASAKSGARIE